MFFTDTCSDIKVRFYLPAKFSDTPVTFDTFCFIKKSFKGIINYHDFP